MAVSIIGPKFYAWDSNTGKPLAFGKVYTYQAGTNTPKATFTTEGGETQNANPVILNGAGYADIFLNGSYKIVVKDADDVEVWTSDPVSDPSQLQQEWVRQRNITQVNTTTFTVDGELTGEYVEGVAVRVKQDSGFVVGNVVSATYADGKTTVTLKFSGLETITASAVYAERAILTAVSLPGSVQSQIDMRTIYVGSVAELEAFPAVVGQKISTLGYYSAGDGGGNDYEIVSGGTGTADGGRFIDLDNGLQAKGLFEGGLVFVAQYGAVGDGVTDDYASLKAANLSGFAKVLYDRKTYLVSDTLPFASKTSYFGIFDEAFIKSAVDAKPVGASQAWLSSEGVSPTGRLHMIGISFLGEKTNLTQKGFVLHDYYSTLDHMTVLNCGGGGLQMTQQKDDATVAAGNLAENKLIYPIIRNCGGKLLDLGEADNNKLTDGYVEGAILDGEIGLTTQHLFCGSAAGWQIDGVHCYGTTASFTTQLQNCNNTRFTDFFIEAFTDRAVSAEKIQGDTVISGQINADQAASGAYAVVLGKSSVASNTSVNVDVAVSLDVATSNISCLYNDIVDGEVQAKIRRQGAQKALLTRVSAPDATRLDQVRFLDDAQVFGALRDSQTESTTTGLRHVDKRLSYGYNSGRKSGTTAQTVTIPITLASFEKLSGTITIEANSFDNGVNRARYHGMFFVSAKTNGTDAWVATLTPIITPTGFSAAPAITATNTSGTDGTIDVTFTFADSDATGVCTVNF